MLAATTENNKKDEGKAVPVNKYDDMKAPHLHLRRGRWVTFFVYYYNSVDISDYTVLDGTLTDE